MYNLLIMQQGRVKRRSFFFSQTIFRFVKIAMEWNNIKLVCFNRLFSKTKLKYFEKKIIIINKSKAYKTNKYIQCLITTS